MKSKPLNPHLTNTTSTIANEMPSIGKDAAPPELITSVDPDFTPKDSVPENTQRMTGSTQDGAPKQNGANNDLQVGEIEGGSFRVEPLRRTGEDPNTMRARLLCQSFLTGAVTASNFTLTDSRPKQEKGNIRERFAIVDIRGCQPWLDDAVTIAAIRSLS